MNEETQEIFNVRTEEYIREEVFVQEEGISDDAPNFSQKQSVTVVLEKVIVTVLIGLVFLLPIFFLPIDGVFSGFSKNILLFTAVISAFLLTLSLWIKEEVLVLPKNPLFTALFFLVVVYAFSSLLSGSFPNSFFGAGAEITTSFELLLLSILLFLFAIFFRTRERIFYAFIAIFTSVLFVFLFQILHFIFPSFTTVAGLPLNKTTNLIGQWGDFGIFSGVIVVLSLIAIETLPPIGKMARNALYFLLIIALFFHALVFYSNSWAILGFIALTISIFTFLNHTRNTQRDVSTIKKRLISPSLVVGVFSILLVFIGSSVNNKLFEILNIPPVQDVRPSFMGTYQVARGMFADKTNISRKENFFGVGPNRFFIPWQKYRPAEVNYTPWWGVDFNEGVGTIPSTAISSGVLGLLGWIVFIFLFFFGGLRALRKKFKQMDAFTQYAAMASFVSASYCWIVIFLNTVGVVPFALAFIFSGLFLGALSASGLPQVRDYNYTRNPQKGFTIAVILLLLFGASATLGYKVIERTRSFFAYRNAVLAGAIGDFEKSQAEFKKALLLAPNDTYFRSFSVLNSYHAEQLISRKDLSPDDLREQFGESFRASVESANKSVEFDGANYLNWLTLGNAYSLLVPLGIENVSSDAYVKAKSAYEEAVKRNPLNPQIPYILAKLALSKNESAEAVKYAKKAIDLKNDYAEALVFLSQIEDSRGHSSEALATIEKASALNFSNPTILFQLGYLRYKNGDYEMAASALEKAVQMVPDYANAKYFLGLSYFEFGRVKDSLKEFTEISHLNPDRTDISQIVRNLKNGYSPLSSSVPENTPSLFVASTTEKDETPHKKR